MDHLGKERQPLVSQISRSEFRMASGNRVLAASRTPPGTLSSPLTPVCVWACPRASVCVSVNVSAALSLLGSLLLFCSVLSLYLDLLDVLSISLRVCGPLCSGHLPPCYMQNPSLARNPACVGARWGGGMWTQREAHGQSRERPPCLWRQHLVHGISGNDENSRSLHLA